MARPSESQLFEALDQFAIELPSWGFADTGTRFGKFVQPAAASTIDEKLEDAGICHSLTGACPTVAVHVLWDFAADQDPAHVSQLAAGHGVKIGSINPNVFQDQAYKYGSLAGPDPDAARRAFDHISHCITLGRSVGSDLLSLWFADGTNYPGQDNLRRRKRAMGEALSKLHAKMPPSMTMLIEYKPFEPAFYHTDIADWGMAASFAREAGPNAKVLVDTGHHLPGANVAHIVSFLLDEGALGGFHFNDRKYADDDLTMGSIDPYGAFLIFNAIAQHEHDTARPADIAYMVDQSHNLKNKVEAALQTVDTAQKLFLKARMVDREALARAQAAADVVAAEACLVDAFETDVRELLSAWRREHDLPTDPIAEYRASGHEKQAALRRTRARAQRGETAAGASYA